MVKWLLIALAGLAALVVLVAVIGYFLPQGHVASRQATYRAPAGDVFAAISDVARYGEWRKDVEHVEVLSADPRRWKEKGSNGEVTFEVQEARAPERLVVRISDPNLPFGGTWTYELRPVDGATRLVITERGEVYNPIFRFMSRFVFSQTSTIEGFLSALGTKLGEQVTPTAV